MKKITIVVSMLIFGAFLWAQVNPRGTASMEGGKITIDYGRPSAKGRDVLGMAQPDSYWRMGADAATTLRTEVDLIVGGEGVPAGEYTLLAHFVTADEFHLVVAKGVSDGRPEEVAAKVEGEIAKSEEHVEQMTIDFEGGDGDAAIVLSWGTYRIRMPFEVSS